jgi:hypothetical protein
MFLNEEITGRDTYIIAKALIYAITYIQSLPERRQEWSDMADMCGIVKALPNDALSNLKTGVFRHTGTPIDLNPA